ncbi:MAG TPA: hypothetical protein VK890_11555 [Bacteroidia bacterium]|jgi:hypothetical protein|nr:hypothetical protein [Bacteroidia bacterium]
MRKIYFYFSIVLAIIVLPFTGKAQYFYNRFGAHNEWVFGAGPSQFLGDLGGSPTVGTHFLKDFNFSAIRYGGFVGYRDFVNPELAIRGTLIGGMVSGFDALSSEEFRHNRNLNFRSPILELSVQAEYYFYQSSHIGHRYHIKHAHGFKRFNIDGYVFAGIGGLYFNPQGEYTDGTWYNLRPLSTEGEGLPGGPKEYSQFAFCIPAGIGFKYNVNPQFTIGLEISDRIWTSSDYIDDAHGTYFDNAAILAAKGPIAAYFADPSLHSIGTDTSPIPPDRTGEERADSKHNDTYMFTFLTFTYSPSPFHRRTRSKF